MAFRVIISFGPDRPQLTTSAFQASWPRVASLAAPGGFHQYPPGLHVPFAWDQGSGRATEIVAFTPTKSARRRIVRILDGWPTAEDLLGAYRRIELIT
jgi:hypothetical protein